MLTVPARVRARRNRCSLRLCCGSRHARRSWRATHRARSIHEQLDYHLHSLGKQVVVIVGLEVLAPALARAQRVGDVHRVPGSGAPNASRSFPLWSPRLGRPRAGRSLAHRSGARNLPLREAFC